MAIMNMDKTIINLPVYRETRFRNPSPYERRIGFWVDRIGSARYVHETASRLRILGQYAVVAVESGAGVFLTKNKGIHNVKSRDVFLLTPDEPTAYYPHKTWFTRWIVWNGSVARQQAEAVGIDRQKPVFRQAADVVRRAFFALVKLMEIEDKAAALERQAVILNTLAGLLRAEHSAVFMGDARPNLEVVAQHIRRHLDSKLTPAELAELCHLSVPHFRRMFHRHTGRSPMEFVLAERISGAKSLLIRGASIKQAAQEMGFADQFYFMRVFKKIAGQTAGQFIAVTRGIGTSGRDSTRVRQRNLFSLP
jgi:AraC-like DNA-binding protein